MSWVRKTVSPNGWDLSEHLVYLITLASFHLRSEWASLRTVVFGLVKRSKVGILSKVTCQVLCKEETSHLDKDVKNSTSL